MTRKRPTVVVTDDLAAHRREQQRVRIATLQAEAAYLLRTATHETMKEQVRITVRDLCAAHSWHEEECHGRGGNPAMVDALLALADLRLNIVSGEMASFGPGAQSFS